MGNGNILFHEKGHDTKSLRTPALEDKNKYSFFISPTTPSEIYNIIDKNTSKYSTDIFNMNTILFKYINDEISPILSLLFNRCINEGLFPDEFKKAKIKPLYKSGSKNDMLNFRPISILPQISKYFEKIIKFRLVDFLNKYSIIDKLQYGFRKNMSTGDALADLIETINDNLENLKKYSVVYQYLLT